MKLNKATVAQQVRQEMIVTNQQVTRFRSLPTDTLRYRPGPDRWSVLDCLEHISLTYADYFSRMEAAIHQASPTDGTTYTAGFFAQKMIDGQRPHQGKRRLKMKTFKKLTPATDKKTPEQIFETLFQYHTRLEQLLTQAEALDWNRVKVTSALGPILRFKLGDCFRFLLAHTERHILQAQEVLKAQTMNTK